MKEEKPGPGHAATPLRSWWTDQIIRSVDHRTVVEKVREDAGWSAHFAFMTIMSAGIAVLGLLLSSPAIVIGAMLISPLMGPIIGLGFALATFDSVEMRRTLRALGLGIVAAVGFCAVLVLLSPLQTVTNEIAVRTRPNLFDLLVALFSGLAGTYAMIRGRHGTIVGVAIATALMPPLAVMGFGLATANWTVLAGSSLLFSTNLMTIAAAAAMLARIYGFAQTLSPRQTRLQATLIVVTLLALAVPLGLALKKIAWEAIASRDAREAIISYFGPDAKLSELEMDYDNQPVEVAATVFAPNYRPKAEAEIQNRLHELLDAPVHVTLDQIRTEDGDSEEREIAAAKGSLADRDASRLAERLALVAGVSPDQVFVDRSTRRALVRAPAVPGIGLAGYQALEGRIAAMQPGWSISLIPPADPLPDVEWEGDSPSADGARAIAIAAWAAKRLGLTVSVSASDAENAEAVVEELTRQGAKAQTQPGGRSGDVQLQWMLPG